MPINSWRMNPMDEVYIGKTKDCNNPALDGKYCDFCTQARKETRNKVLGAAGTAVIAGGGVAAKKGLLKKVPELAIKAVRLVLKK